MMSFVVLSLVVSAMTVCVAEHYAVLEIALAADGLAPAVVSTTLPLATSLRRRRGRPRKFNAPSKAVTLTLPESVLARLAEIDPDPSRAIVHLAKRRVSINSGRPAAELAVFGGRAVISIKPTPSLEHRTGIDLVPLPDGRALISFEQPKTIADLELMIYDALEDRALSGDDRQVFEGIGNILKEARRAEDVTLLHRNIILLESNGARRRKARTRNR